VSKAWVLGALRPNPFRRLEIIPGFLRLQYAENRGAAFSLFQNHPGILTAVAMILATAVLVWAVFFLPREERLTRLALGLIFGGAVGNIIDRLRFRYVLDFIEVYWRNVEFPPLIPWPRFNVADSSICIGIAAFFVASLLAARGRPEKPDSIK